MKINIHCTQCIRCTRVLDHVSPCISFTARGERFSLFSSDKIYYKFTKNVSNERKTNFCSKFSFPGLALALSIIFSFALPPGYFDNSPDALKMLTCPHADNYIDSYFFSQTFFEWQFFDVLSSQLK